jgi:hypothetical protein
MDSSKFNLWRSLFAFCHIDGKVTPEEVQWMTAKLSGLNFTDEQKNILQTDYRAPPRILDLLPLITKPSDRAFLVDQMRVIGHLDKDFSESEKNKMQLVHKEVMSRINLPELESMVSQVHLEMQHDQQSIFPAGSILNSFVRHSRDKS